MISVSDVHKFYGDTHAVAGVSFDVAPGELVFLVGPSGSGKTTLLKLLSRELCSDSGEVCIAGVDIGKLSYHRIPALRRMVAVMPQEYRMLANRSVESNLMFALTVNGWRRRAAQRRTSEVLEAVGLSGYGKRFPSELSGGERQRIVLARAIAGRPAVLIADEPTGNLDPAGARLIADLLGGVAASGTAVLVATHNEAVVNEQGRRVIAVSQGCLVADGVGSYADITGVAV